MQNCSNWNTNMDEKESRVATSHLHKRLLNYAAFSKSIPCLLQASLSLTKMHRKMCNASINLMWQLDFKGYFLSNFKERRNFAEIEKSQVQNFPPCHLSLLRPFKLNEKMIVVPTREKSFYFFGKKTHNVLC